ncbi:DMT family transporter [Nocardia sp. NPDC019395]|uniref:DMT family transporter n=1 Tax=Nocardia sp. NPDC019395 TaxID=3154686 RepID=UPI0033FA584A
MSCPSGTRLKCAVVSGSSKYERKATVSRPKEYTEIPGAASSARDAAPRVLAAAAVTVVLWASAFIAIRSSASYFGPGPLALGRLLVAAAALGGVLLVRREGFPPRAAWPGTVASGLLWFAAYMFALNWGEREVDAGTAAMIVNVGPILMAILGGWLLKEGFPGKLMAGLVVSFAGAVVVGIATSGDGGSSAPGVLLCLAAAITYALGVVLQKPALNHASPLQVTTFGALIGAVACLPFAGQLVSEVSRAPASATLQVVYLGVFPTALAFTTWAYAVSRTTAGKMGSTTYAVPVIVVLMSWLVLDEVPAPLALIGGLLCLCGVAVSRIPGRSPQQQDTAQRPVPAPSGERARPDR